MNGDRDPSTGLVVVSAQDVGRSCAPYPEVDSEELMRRAARSISLCQACDSAMMRPRRSSIHELPW